jgi:hypothetical protein
MGKGASMLNLNGFFVLMGVVLIGAIVLGLALAGTFNPKDSAIANGINLQNGLDQQRGEIDLKYYEPVKQADIQAQIDKLAEDNRFQRALHDQQLLQNDQVFQQNATLKDWATRGLVIGGVAVLLIIAVAGAILLLGRTWGTVTQVRTAHQVAHQVAVDNARHGVLSKAVGEIGATLSTMQNESAQMREELKQLTAQLMETKVTLEQLKARGNGSGAGGEPHMSEKVIRLKSIA